MPKITSVKPQKNQKRVNIYLDGKFGFGVDLESFLKLGLKVGQELEEDEVEKIVKEAEFQKTYDKILKFAALRPRSEKEFRDWLKKHNVPESLYNELFNRLKKLDFLNDKKFAAWWVEQRQTFRPKSEAVLKQELRLKGIDKKIIDEVLEESNIDEIATARGLLEKKKYLWERLPEFEARKKKASFLQRMGFEWDVIREVLRIEELE